MVLEWCDLFYSLYMERSALETYHGKVAWRDASFPTKCVQICFNTKCLQSTCSFCIKVSLWLPNNIDYSYCVCYFTRCLNTMLTLSWEERVIKDEKEVDFKWHHLLYHCNSFELNQTLIHEKEFWREQKNWKQNENDETKKKLWFQWQSIYSVKYLLTLESQCLPVMGWDVLAHKNSA